MHGLHQVVQAVLFLPLAEDDGAAHPRVEFIQTLADALEVARGLLLVDAVVEMVKPHPRPFHLPGDGAVQLFAQAVQALRFAAQVGATLLGGGSRCWRAQVGGQVGEGHVRFVSHATDDGDTAGSDSADEVRVVVRP